LQQKSQEIRRPCTEATSFKPSVAATIAPLAMELVARR